MRMVGEGSKYLVCGVGGAKDSHREYLVAILD